MSAIVTFTKEENGAMIVNIDGLTMDGNYQGDLWDTFNKAVDMMDLFFRMAAIRKK